MPFPCNDDRCDEAKQSTFRKDRTHTVLVFAHTLCLNVWHHILLLNCNHVLKMLFSMMWLILKRVPGRVAYISKLLKVKSSITTYCIWILIHWHLWLMLHSIRSQTWDIPTWYLRLPSIKVFHCQKFGRWCIRKYNGNATVCCTDLDCQQRSLLVTKLEDKWCYTVLAFVLQVYDYLSADVC